MTNVISWLPKSGWRKPLVFGWLAIGMIAIVLFSMERLGSSSESAVFSSTQSDVIDADLFVSANRFASTMAVAIAEADARTEPCGDTRGGVVNHHILASDLLASFFAELARCRPDAERIIILSPDHYFQGQAPIVTHAVSYRTNQDVLPADSETVGRLLARVSSARDEAKPFPNEHGIGALVPFLHKTLPKTRVIPVLINGRATNASVKALSDWLADELKNPTTLVVVSSDMSHYLPQPQAEKNDRVTLAAFAKNDAEFFWQANDDFTDNGKSLWAAVTAIRKISPPQFRLFKTAISSEYGGSTGYTTSYITGFWEGRAACPVGACE
jgi:AmmeMemoRadiSam system protein B